MTTSNEIPKFMGEKWYAASVLHLPEQLRQKVSCHCGKEWYDAYRTVASIEILRLRQIIEELTNEA